MHVFLTHDAGRHQKSLFRLDGADGREYGARLGSGRSRGGRGMAWCGAAAGLRAVVPGGVRGAARQSSRKITMPTQYGARLSNTRRSGLRGCAINATSVTRAAACASFSCARIDALPTRTDNARSGQRAGVALIRYNHSAANIMLVCSGCINELIGATAWKFTNFSLYKRHSGQ